MNKEIRDAAYALLRAVHNTSMAELWTARQRFAALTSESHYADTCEPFNGIFMVLDAEINRRGLRQDLIDKAETQDEE